MESILENFDGSQELIEILSKKISNEEDIESIVCLLETPQKCQELLKFLRQETNCDSNRIWRKAISISE